MKEFDVIISETMERKVTVFAENSHDAEEQAELEWDQGKHVLDYNDFKSSNFTTIAEREKLLNVLLVEPMKPPTEITIPDTLQSLRDTLGGNIETLNPV